MSKLLKVSLLTAALAATHVRAHARVYTYWVDGTDVDDNSSGVATFIRSPPNNNPVKDLTSTDVRCNVGGTTAPTTSFSAAAGSTITPEWYHDSRGDDIIAASHVGPIVTYIAPAASNGEGDVWVKIAESGYASGSWAVSDLIANKGKHDVVLPKTLTPGKYIVRDEILALHESDVAYTSNSARGVQLYPSCAQLTVTSGGSQDLPAGVAFPGTYKDDTPGIVWSVYGSNDPTTYVIPGPAVWDGSSTYSTAQAGDSSSATATTAAAAATSAKAATSSVAEVTASSVAVSTPEVSSADADVQSSVVDVVSSSAPEATTSAAAAAAAAVTTSRSVCTARTRAATSAVATASATKAATSVAGSTTTATAAASEATDYSGCMRIYNKCLDASQPTPDFTGCQSSLDACTGGLTRRKMERRIIGKGHHQGRRV